RTRSVQVYHLEGSQPGGAIAWGCYRESPVNNSFIPSSNSRKYPMETPSLKRPAATETLTAFIGMNTLPVNLDTRQNGSEVVCETRLTDQQRVTSSEFTWSVAKGQLLTVPYVMTGTGESQLECIVRDRNSKAILGSKTLKVSAAGYSRDKAYLKASASELDQLSRQLPPADFAMAGNLSASVAKLTTALAEAGKLKDPAAIEAANRTIEENRHRLGSALKYGHFANRIRAAGNNKTFYVWQNPNPWDETEAEDIYPEKPVRDTLQVRMLMMGNETEALALNITNLAEGTQMVKIYPYDLTDSQGKRISQRDVLVLHEAIKTPSTRGTMVDEALPLMNEAHTLYLGASDTRKLWINVNSVKLAPGKYTFLLGVESVSLIESVQLVKVNLEVSTVRVPDKNELAFNTWSSIEINDEVMRDKVVKDLIAHKIGVLSMLPPPRFYLGEDGKVKGDWDHWDKYYTPLKDQIICFVTGAVSVDTKGKQVSPEQYAALLKEAYALGAQGMADRGIRPDQWAIYVMDEPALTGFPSILQAVKICQEIRAAKPDMELYTDPAGLVTPETMKSFEGLIDVYSPQIDLLKDPNHKLLDYFHSLKKRIWFYEAPAPARNFHPLGHNRVQAWLAFDYGLTGCGYWNYNSNNVNNSWRLN
ncbi:MAG: hypothetical protein LWW85_15680, partial [Marinilabiliales bacterium]|nr:hypothetical protein [Marinilabiliales bacterium]